MIDEALRALMARPKLLLLDEPSLGLAPLIVDLVFEVLGQLRETGVTILLVEQNAARTIEFADRTYVLSASSVIQYFSSQTTFFFTSSGRGSTSIFLPSSICVMSSHVTSTFRPVSRTTAVIAARCGAWSCSCPC